MEETQIENSPTPEQKEQKKTVLTDEQLVHFKGIIEAILFVNERPVTLNQFRDVLEGVSGADIKTALASLTQDYENRQSGIKVVEIAGGYQMFSNPKYASYIRAFYKTKHKEKLSKPALETLAIIAYKQPVTRTDIELVRGVNSDGVVNHLQNKELVKIVGRKDIPGKPYLYGTTKQFMEYFGLKSLEDLPTLAEFPDLKPPAEEGMLAIEDAEAVENAQLQEENIPPAESAGNEGENSEAQDRK